MLASCRVRLSGKLPRYRNLLLTGYHYPLPPPSISAATLPPQMEESRAIKKIDETKKRANEIMSLKQRDEASFRSKQENRQQEEMLLQSVVQKNALAKAQRTQSLKVRLVAKRARRCRYARHLDLDLTHAFLHRSYRPFPSALRFRNRNGNTRCTLRRSRMLS